MKELRKLNEFGHATIHDLGDDVCSYPVFSHSHVLYWFPDCFQIVLSVLVITPFLLVSPILQKKAIIKDRNEYSL